MAYKQKSHGSSFKMMGASPVKQWQAPAAKELVKKGLQWVGKNKVKSGFGAMAASDVPGMWDDKKSWYHNVGDIAWDNSAGFAFDALDVIGAATGGWKERSINRPWDSKDRKNWMGN